MISFEIDDPLSAFAVHGMGGTWGMIAVGLFSTDAGCLFAQYNQHIIDKGIGMRFAHQLLAVVVIGSWSLSHAGLLFYLLKKFDMLRVEQVVERDGLDKHEHGGTALTMNSGYTVRGKQHS